MTHDRFPFPPVGQIRQKGRMHRSRVTVSAGEDSAVQVGGAGEVGLYAYRLGLELML